MISLSQYNPPYKEQTLNNCLIHVLSNAICNRYKKQTGKDLTLNVIELGKKISTIMWGNPNLINSIGGNLGLIIKVATNIELRDDKGNFLDIRNVQSVKVDDKSIYDELAKGNAICWSGIGSLTKLSDRNIFEKKETSGSHAMLLDTFDEENKKVVFQNSINLMERVECELEHIYEYTMNCWTFDLVIEEVTKKNNVTEKISLEKWKSKPEDQNVGNSCTIFQFENNLTTQLNRLKGVNDSNFNEYSLNSQVEDYHSLPQGYIESNGFNPELILEAFSKIEIGNTGIKIKYFDNLYLGNQEMALYGILNSLWKGSPVMVACKGHSFRNENGDWEWEYNLEKPIYYHEMNVHSMEVKNGINYLVMENSYYGKDRMYLRISNIINVINVAHTFELDYTNTRVEIIKRGDKNRELSFEQTNKYL